nr:spindle assembly checkpoint component MAD1-like [Drosophila suzukii]
MSVQPAYHDQQILIENFKKAIPEFFSQKNRRMSLNDTYTLIAEIRKNGIKLDIYESIPNASDVTRLNEEVRHLKGQVAINGAELNDKKKCMEEMESKLRAKEREVQKSESKVKEKTNEITRLQEEVAILKRQFAINGAELSSKKIFTEEMGYKLRAKESEISSLKGNIAELKSAAFVSSKQLEEHNKYKSDMEAKVGVHKIEISTLTKKVAKLESAALESSQILDHNNKFITNLIYENSISKEKLQSAAFEIHNHVNEKRRCKLEIISLEEKIVNLEESFKNATECLPDQLKFLVCSLYETKKKCFNKVCSMLE